MNDQNRKQRMRMCASATFYDDEPNQIGSMTSIECYADAFHVVKLNWGSEEDSERNKEGEVEMCWTVQGDDLVRLMKICNSAETPEAVVDYLKERFSSYGRQAYYELLNWFQKKVIHYSYTEY